MKLPKTAIAELEEIRRRLKAGITFLQSPGYAFAKRDKYASTTLHYTRADGSILYEVDREIGSDLCQIYNALSRLNALLESAKQPQRP